MRAAAAAALLRGASDTEAANAAVQAGRRVCASCPLERLRTEAVAHVTAIKARPTSTWDEIVRDPIGSWAQGADDALKLVTSVPEFLGKLTDPVTWIRVAEVLGGAVLVYMGLRTVLAELGGPRLPSIGQAASMAANVVPAGRVANVVKGAAK